MSARRTSGFTLIELLMVITILGILAGLVAPSVKNLRKGDVMAAASSQMIDAITRARQLATSQRTTVYLVFVPPQFWQDTAFTGNSQLTLADRIAATNLAALQLTGYNYLALRSVGDQPGQGIPKYLGEWQTLPDGSIFAADKFAISRGQYLTNLLARSGLTAWGFDYSTNLPFPRAETLAYSAGPDPNRHYPALPYIAFDYMGRVVSGQDEFIPLAHGGVSVARDDNKVPLLIPFPQISALPNETPAGNYTNTYNLVHVDWLTGRARHERQEIQ
ncbi:MAG: prepilin-type N-terminal cleavage/methylation domain-containing protein [Verrucomicrobiota bacterium]